MRTCVHGIHRWLITPVIVLSLAIGSSLAVAASEVVVHEAASARPPALAVDTPLEQTTPVKPPPSSKDDADTTVPPSETTDKGNADLEVKSLDDVRLAVVQIEAVGTFADPAEGTVMNAAGRGSGFIIDPAGIAVTNNHVVTGAAFLKVYVAGETEPRNARVLGVSECSDLAVIDIQGDGYHYLDWTTKPVKVGLEIYAAGFPLGDPEYTLTRGIIAKAKANGDSNWASVDHVIQHDASTNPGNSGGPIIDADGAVIAIHYAGNATTNQYFAIAADEAAPVVEKLRSGQNVESIGINGEAVTVGDNVSGIWVASVASGSAADRAGIKAGDIILTMEGVSLATEGTMSEYCNILRSHAPDDVLSIQVLRLGSKEMWEGQLNGRPLEMKFSLAEDIQQGGDQPGGAGASTTAAYDEYVTISDDSGVLAVEIPAAWKDVDGSAWVSNDKEIGVKLVASPDVKAMNSGWDTPGLFFGASADLAASTTPADLLDSIDYKDNCTYEGRKDYPPGSYTGSYDLWSKCGDAKSTAAVVALTPESGAYIALLEIYSVSDADLDALDHILASFTINLATSSTSSDQPATNVDTGDLLYDYVTLSEPALSALVPKTYADIETGDWEVDGDVVGVTVTAAPNVKKYNETWDNPGLKVRSTTGMTEDIDINDWLDSYDLSEYCKRGDRVKHSHAANDQTYNGAYDIWTDCSDSGSLFFHVVAVSDPPDQLVLIDFQAADEADVEAFKVLLESFYIPGTPSTTTNASSNTSSNDQLEFEYTTLIDDSNSLSVRVPTTWDDVKLGNWTENDKTVGFSISAAPDLEKYNSTWDSPGMFFGATALQPAGMTAKKLLDQWDYTNTCTDVQRYDYDDSVYVGVYDLYSDCDGKGNLFVVLAATPKNIDDIFVFIQVAIPAGTSEEPFQQILKSFSVDAPDNLYNMPTDSGSSTSPTAEVLVASLNLRAGPGTNYNRVGSANKGDVLRVTGQFNDCSWLKISTDSGAEGWVSGGQQYVTLDGDCANIPAASAPPLSNSNTGNAGSSGAVAAGKGCYLFQNQLNAELTITFTSADGKWNKTFKVARGGDHSECFNPGKYTYTLDAPPPWGSSNGELQVKAGDNYRFPISGN